MPTSINVNIGVLMGEISSTFRMYKNEDEWGIEFDIIFYNYIGNKSNVCSVTCLSIGTQAELIINQKKQGDTICVTGYIGSKDAGLDDSGIGKHKFRITGVHFKNMNIIMFAGKILTQPTINKITGDSEFHIATYRTHRNVNLDPCKIKVVCSNMLSDIIQSSKEVKSVGDYIEVLGFLNYENGSHVLRAKRIELLIDDDVKNKIIKDISDRRNNERDKNRSKGNNDKEPNGVGKN